MLQVEKTRPIGGLGFDGCYPLKGWLKTKAAKGIVEQARDLALGSRCVW